MNTDAVIALARKHVGFNAENEGSARLCLADAVSLRDRGQLDDAKRRALNSLSYSVGCFSNTYKRAAS